MRKRIFLTLISVITLSFLYQCITYADNVIIQANKQVYDEKTKQVTIEGNVKVSTQDITVRSPKAFVQTGPDGKPATAMFIDGAHAIKNDGITQSDVKSNIMKVSLIKNSVSAQGNVITNIIKNKQLVATIKSNEQNFDSNTNIVIATGNVNITYKDVKTKSDEARILIDKPSGQLRQVNLLGSANVVQNKSVIDAAVFIFNPVSNELIAQGKAHSKSTLDDGTPVDIWSDYQHYDKPSSTLITSGKVKLIYKDYISTGPKATFLPENNGTKPNKIIFLGRSRIVEGTRNVEANKIVITLNPKNFVAVGNVKTKFVQEQKADDSSAKNSKKSNKATKNSKNNTNNQILPPEVKKTMNVPQLPESTSLN